jgi:hypothetical protein
VELLLQEKGYTMKYDKQFVIMAWVVTLACGFWLGAIVSSLIHHWLKH